MSSLGAHVVLAAITILGLGVAAYLLDVPWVWVVAGVVFALGVLIRSAARRSRAGAGSP